MRFSTSSSKLIHQLNIIDDISVPHSDNSVKIEIGI